MEKQGVAKRTKPLTVKPAEAAVFDLLAFEQVLITKPDGPAGRVEISAVARPARAIKKKMRVFVELPGGDLEEREREVDAVEWATEGQVPPLEMRRTIKLVDAEAAFADSENKAASVMILDTLAEMLAPFFDPPGEA